ncbi:hypothetical protein C5167_035195 [Papaver somniferum]|uniref:Protein kinase domain-containing protein n=1 Tax=Papaver somniferum TaxID=3469 RepID=A0A4Y7KF98_PAPSO|nr:serine/threonine-protein kinase BLUS1-like isoform X1 [Papaver somniferum]XP_026405066.1 serine/threonine-protein kinase BLUS1-like isoform X1 [Papaver somniferum]XP_026405067.1 serine/threonine-protein kinase BLUS1-like isoform X1 [Papaver somniferum]RZC72043.1 hypothetical protein C5167_035195 [Papaver somniferum]
MDQIAEKKFPLDAKDYKLYEEVGDGVSATVYRALCVPLNEVVAIKVLDLEKCNNDLDGIRREVQTMTMISHPNVLQAHCSFSAGHHLWVVMPYMAGGSCLGIMKSAFPEGFEEPVIAAVLREVLKALIYLHFQGHIHRDVKSGNILVDTNGAVKLADFGVSACMFDSGDRQRSRNTFVGTPCWMAPEVMQQLHGYDFKADIWSFGITALELAHGHAPFSKYPPMKVLLMTLQNAPPGLDYERDKRFSKSFKEMVATCLVKDPKKRPSSEKLLKHSFFKSTRANEYVSKIILRDLSPLGDRYRTLKEKEAELLLQNKDIYGDKEQLSQKEYMRGISAWNFNLDDLKNQAALIQDYVETSNSEDLDACNKQDTEYDELNEQNLEDSFSSFPIRPLQALKGLFDVGEDDINASINPNSKDGKESNPEPQLQMQLSPTAEEQETKLTDDESSVGGCSFRKFVISGQHKQVYSGSLVPDNVIPHSRRVNHNGDSEQFQSNQDRNYSGSLSYRNKRDAKSPIFGEDTMDGTIVEQKGRFKITSAELNPMDAHTNCLQNQFPTATNVTPASVLPMLHYILQTNAIQSEQILKLIQYLGQTPGLALVTGSHVEYPDAIANASLLQSFAVPAKERELQTQVVHLQQTIGSYVEELQRLKMRNAQLERHFKAYKEGEKIPEEIEL